jgi:hypothetical protein
VPAAFPRDEKIEVAAADDSFHTTVSLSDSSLMLEDAGTAVGNIQPLARFGASAFGPVRVRAVAADGVAGDWLPLGTLVRLPGFNGLHCPRAVSKPCLLDGTNLFLAASIAATPTFDTPTEVPAEFTGTELIVPHPTGGTLYVKLRDDPATVQTLTLPVTLLSLPAASQARANTPPGLPAPGPSAIKPATESEPTAPAQPETPAPEAAPNASGAPAPPDTQKPN